MPVFFTSQNDNYVPDDCKKISKDEVEMIFTKIVDSWKHWQDVWVSQFILPNIIQDY